MSIIYQPAGKAYEYSPLAANLYRGCSHACTYCYAPAVLRMGRDDFSRDPQPRPGVVEAIRKEAPKYAHGNDPVLLCFTSDPYQPCEDEHRITRQVLEIFAENDVPFQILTKGGRRAARDFDILASMPGRCNFGTTMVFNNDNWRVVYEPNAACAAERFVTLQKAHDLGISTWVSLEPVIDTDQTLEIIRRGYSYVDFWKVGKWNHDERAKAIDWRAFHDRVVELLESKGAKYYIKNDLRVYSELGQRIGG